jgi:Flp pilus assembly protein TadG
MKKIRNFLKDRSGATAITFGILLIPIMGMTGLAVDYGLASNERSKLQNAADSAALAGASVFTGTNSAAAEARANAYLKANLGAQADKVSINFSAANQKVNVAISGETNTLFMHLLRQDKVAIGVNATALAPLKPTTATITIDKVTGYWFKRISIVGVKDGTETVVGTITYTAKDHSGENGRGTGTTVPGLDSPVTFQLGDYKTLYLKMEVKTDGCDIGYRNTSSGNIVTCSATSNSSYASYNSTLRTDDPLTVNSLFVDDVRLPKGSKPPILDLLSCDGAEHKHAWEDGGSADNVIQPDFFYRIKSSCKSVDNENVRLTH